MNRTASIAAACACLTSSACSYAIRSPVVEAGVGFSEGRSNEVKKGDTDARVRELLGTPYETNDERQLWRYYMRVRGTEERHLFGFVPVKDATTVREYETVIAFGAGVVETISSSRKRVR
jgi:hypothetical protein